MAQAREQRDIVLKLCNHYIRTRSFVSTERLQAGFCPLAREYRLAGLDADVAQGYPSSVIQVWCPRANTAPAFPSLPYRGPCKICVTNNNLLFTLHDRVLLHSIQEAAVALAERVLVGWSMSKFNESREPCTADPAHCCVPPNPTPWLHTALCLIRTHPCEATHRLQAGLSKHTWQCPCIFQSRISMYMVAARL
jgi:hypothetical protein